MAQSPTYHAINIVGLGTTGVEDHTALSISTRTMGKILRARVANFATNPYT
jgi:hypothetical protein